jgi:hypothetical protein
MGVLWNIVRVAVVAVIVVSVAEISKRSPRLGAVLLSLPIVSILAFLFSWVQHHDLVAISRMARDTLVLVLLSLPFFVPLACAAHFQWNYWASLMAGMLLATISIGMWLLLTVHH